MFDAEKYIASVEHEYDFPTGLQFNRYRDQQRQADVVQAFFRYNPFDGDNGPVGDKFGFEIATDAPTSTGNQQAFVDMKKRECHDALSAMEDAWKAAFNFVYWQDIPYAINEKEGVYTVKCEVCHSARSIDKRGDFEYRRDLYLIYLLKEIEHDCSDGWEPPSVDRNMQVAEGAHFPDSRTRSSQQ